MTRCLRAVAALLLAANAAQAVSTAPLIDKVTIATPTAALQTTITGSAGAAPSLAYLIAVNTQSGHYAVAQARVDGGFSIPLYAAPGDWIELKTDPGGHFAQQFRDGPVVIDHAMSGLISLDGTIVRAPEGLSSPTAFVDSGTTRDFLPYWSIQGSIDKLAYAPGESIAINALYTLHGQAASGQTPSLGIQASFVAVSRADGSGALDQNTYASTLATPTGLPIERLGRAANTSTGSSAPLESADGKLRGTIRFNLPIPAALPAGHYRPILRLNVNGVAGGKPQDSQNVRITTFLGNASRRFQDAAYLPIVKVGSPAAPRMPWTLLANTLSEGIRGLTAVEDRGKFTIVPRIATASERLIVPRIDPMTRAAARYNIEPFALTLGLADRGAPIAPPNVPLRFPSGSLTATVRAPDGTTRVIGPAPFRQIVLNGPANSGGNPMEGGGHISDPVRLSTLDPRFDIEFAEEGRHRITLEGSVEDVWGNVWQSSGTYELDVAQPLLIESMFIPGTPLVAGDAMIRGVRVVPPVPADVEIRVRFAPRSRAEAMIDRSATVRANRFGHARLESLRFNEPGEYRVDIFASYRDPSGRLWAGTQTFGSVVAPRNSGLVAHGRRGTDDQQGTRQQWFTRKQLGVEPGRGHVHLAFASGDVMWLEDRDAMIPVMTVQDRDGTLVPLLEPRYLRLFPAGVLSRWAQDGEIPLHSSTASGLDPHIDPAATDMWAYTYRYIERPFMRVREVIGEEDLPAPYWRFNDRYANQSGNGDQGDWPNDFKFQFGAAVVHGRAVAEPRYAIYGSLFVLVPDDDAAGGTRVFPPFQGNGGGPPGGPLFKLKGKDIDLFFHPSAALAPGSVLHAGQRVTVAGYVAPPLPSKVDIAITSPSGATRTIRGSANDVGYFHDPAGDFIASEPGVWKAKMKVEHDGAISSGLVERPYPTGDVLGSREGEFYFYVLSATAPQLELQPMPGPLRPAEQPVAFRLIRPAGLTAVETHYTVTMPGFILEEGTSSSLDYVYDAQRLAADFPNLDLRSHGQIRTSDVVTFTFFVSGTDASGVRRHFARQVVLNGEELLMPEQRAVAAAGRRRVSR